jgi:hypothetical protein
MAMVVFFGGVQCFLLGIYGEYFLRNLFRTTLPTFVVKREPTSSADESTGTTLAQSHSERSGTTVKDSEYRA